MRVQVGDTVTISGRQGIGIVERRDGLDLTLRLPHERNCRSTFQRDAVRPLAEAMFDARKRGTKYSNDLSLTGASTLAELVAAFGYATQQMRSESLSKVFNQLARAGLQIIPASDRWSRDDTFVLRVQELAALDVAEVVESTPQLALQSIAMPEIFWPTAFGLDPNLEITFLKSLTASSPILCLLHMPDDSELHSWLPATWEGMVSWAYRAAQNFDLRLVENSAGEVFFGPAAMLHAYLNSSVLGAETPQLKTDSRSLNLISLKNESEIPVDMHRIRAIWPGPVFEFKPQPNTSSDSLSADEAAIIQCLFAVAGAKIEPGTRVSPLKAMLWSKETCARILARASTAMGSFLSGDAVRKFKGSNESATALALKADIANWIRRANPDAKLSFEKSQETLDEWDGRIPINRVDLFVEGIGQFEVESMLGSGPMESFYHQKVFSRLSAKDSFLWLVIPNEAILWAGPYLADISHHLAKRGRVVIPGASDAYFEIQGRALKSNDIEIPWDELRGGKKPGETQANENPEVFTIRMSDVVGYGEIRQTVDELIIWPERHRRTLRRTSRSSGILFFGPPGCGKSRLARAIAGELDQEVRLLCPSDLRGAYVGWGQILIREQFDWIAERENRMLVIDELDAVARSRRMSDGGWMISDEMANVNELLVQLDRVFQLGRLVVGTTNFIASLDEAVIRSGRFGRFIPVPPPDLDESVAIIEYYLKRLETRPANEGQPLDQPNIRIPATSEIRTILEPLCALNQQNEHYYCGADLEEAVNRTYLRCMRQTLANTNHFESYSNSNIEVFISCSELERSLASVPRSVRPETVKQFRDDEAQYCGGT